MAKKKTKTLAQPKGTPMNAATRKVLQMIASQACELADDQTMTARHRVRAAQIAATAEDAINGAGSKAES